MLAGFTLTGGQAGGGGNNGIYWDNLGGGALCVPGSPGVNALFDCILTNDYASYYGGGAYGVELVNCLLVNNVASAYGGAGVSCLFINCTLVGNAGGPVANYAVVTCTLENSIIYDNPGNCGTYVNCINCCTIPDPGGVNDITNDPAFVNPANGDYHLQAGSPCINAGTNSFVTTATDLDGNPRIVGSTVDIGTYEYQASTVAITMQPASQTNIIGQTGMLTVDAVSPYPLSFQWYFNSNSIPYATNSSLVLTNIQLTNAGTYSVTVSTSFAATNSANATLTVFYPPPAITQPPTNITVILDSNAMLSVSATCALPMTFQWQHSGTNLRASRCEFSGSATSTLNISGTAMTDTGNYQVIIADGQLSVTSSVATLSVVFPVSITIQPTNQTAIVPNNASFLTSESGTGPLGYQWYFDGNPLTDGGNISGSASPNLNFSGVQLTNQGLYQLLVTNSFSWTTSSVVTADDYLAPSRSTIFTNPVNEAYPDRETQANFSQ